MSYIGQGLPADTFQGFTTDTFSGDGSATTFTLSKEPFSEDTLIVVINNVIQQPTTNFTVSGTTLTIVGTAVATGNTIYAIHMGGPLPIGGASELDLNGASDKLILDEDADTTISADTDDQIDIKIAGADDFQFTANTFKALGGSTITTPTLGVNDTHAMGTGIHIKAGSSGATNLAAADDLVIESDGSAGINIFTGTSGTGQINFGDSGANERGKVKYDHSNDKMTFTAGSIETLTIEPGGQTNTTSSEHNNTAFEVKHTGDGSSSFPYGQAIRFTNANRDNNTEYFHYAIDSAGLKFVVYSDGDVKNHDNSYGSTSDERIKQDIRDSNSQWDDIKAVKVRNFKKKDDVRQYGDKAWEQIGVIAQELEDAGMDKLIKHSDPTAGDIASDSSFGTVDGDGKITVKEQVKGVSYSVLYMKAIKALQESMAKIETLETKVKALEDA
jgi:hypothetical protein